MLLIGVPSGRLCCCTLFAVVALMLGGCAQTGRKPSALSSKPAIASPPPKNADSDLRFHVLAGELALQRGLAGDAVNQYMAAMAASDDPKIAKRATRLALLADREEAARRAASRWATLAPDDVRAREVAARLAIAAGNVAEATDDAKAAIRLDSDGEEAAFHKLILLFSSENEHADAAVAVMHNLARAYPHLAVAQYALGALEMHADQSKAAAASADRALAIDPHLSDAYLLKAAALLQQNDKAGADAVMRRAFAREPHNLDLRVGYARLLLKTDHKDAARDEFQRVLKRQSDNPDALFALGLIALDDNQLDRARHYLMALRKTGTHPNSSAYYLGRLEEAASNNQQALTWYERVQSGPKALDAALRRALMLEKLNRTDDAIDFLVQVRNDNPGLAHRLYLVQGQILVDAQRYPQAIKLFDSALKQFPADPDLLYSRSMAEVESDHPDKAEADLKALIGKNAKDARALNALGYVMVEHGGNLKQARDYIQRALRLTPDDPAVIDSMGWVEYRLGYTALALTYLKRAYQQSPDPEIGAHLGAALWSSGDHEAARKIWRQGLKDDPDNATIRELMKKLTGQSPT